MKEMDDLQVALHDLRGAFLQPLADFLYGPFFRPFMALGVVACIGLWIYGLVVHRWDLVAVALVMETGYGYFAFCGFPRG